MSDFFLNDAGMKAFVTGPVTRDLERRARNVRDDARGKVRHIMHRRPSIAENVRSKIELVPLRAEVGIVDRSGGGRKESIEEYLANKEGREVGGAWLEPALRSGLRRRS